MKEIIESFYKLSYVFIHFNLNLNFVIDKINYFLITPYAYNLSIFYLNYTNNVPHVRTPLISYPLQYNVWDIRLCRNILLFARRLHWTNSFKYVFYETNQILSGSLLYIAIENFYANFKQIISDPITQSFN